MGSRKPSDHCTCIIDYLISFRRFRKNLFICKLYPRVQVFCINGLPFFLLLNFVFVYISSFLVFSSGIIFLPVETINLIKVRSRWKRWYHIRRKKYDGIMTSWGLRLASELLILEEETCTEFILYLGRDKAGSRWRWIPTSPMQTTLNYAVYEVRI